MRQYRPVLLAASAYLVLTLAYVWPLPLRMAHGVVHDPGDPLLNTWILWWSTRAVPLTAHWWNAPIFYPAAGTFAFSEHLLGLFPLSAPFIAFAGQPLLGYNVALLASYVLSGLGAYFLGYVLTRRHDAAFIAGLAYAFAPYRLSQISHLQVISGYWAPVCLAALHRYTEQPRVRWAVLAAAAWLLQALACGYYLFFLSLLLCLWFLWFALSRWPRRQFAIALVAWSVAALFVAPTLAGYKHILRDTYGFSRGFGAIQAFGADVGGVLSASHDLLLWGWVHAIEKPEGELFPGPTIVVLAAFVIFAARPFAARVEATRHRLWWRHIFASLFLLFMIAAALPIAYGAWRLTIGGVRIVSIARPDKPLTLAFVAALGWMATQPAMVAAARRRSQLAFYALAAFAMWVFALGPDPTFFGNRALYRAPYGWLIRLPAFDGLRVPARIWMMCLVCLSALAALAINRLHGRTRRIVVVAAAVGLVLDGWPGVFTVDTEPQFRPVPAGSALRLDLPVNIDNDAVPLYQQMREGLPLYNGYSGYDAPHYYALHELVEAHDTRVLKALATAGPLGIVVDHARDNNSAMERWLAGSGLATPAHVDAGWSSYRVDPVAWTPPPDVSGTVLPIKSVDAYPSAPHAVRAIDHDLATRWSGGVQEQSAGYSIELATPSRVGQLVLYLGEYMTDFPRRLRVDVSPDGAAWETVFLDDTALQAYYGALRHPRQVPLVIPIGRDNVRSLRLMQLGSGRHDWSIAELEVRE